MPSTFYAALLVLLLSPPVVACGPPELASNSQIPTTFTYESGWVIPGLAGASVVRIYRDESGSDVTEYKPNQAAFVDLQGFELSADGKSLRLVPGYAQWVTGIVEYRVQGRIYAYGVVTVSTAKSDPPMWQRIQSAPSRRRKGVPAGVLGCGWTTLRYFDADGDGSFESLEYVGFGGPRTNSTLCPSTPEWALKLMPNRAAAERCATPERNIFELPSVLRDLMSERPLAPILAPATDSQPHESKTVAQ
jgi:hypothetical protein